MKKSTKRLLAIILVILVAIQFIQPAKNQGVINNDHIFNQAVIPDPVKTILQNSCMDCHSNQTNYPWYDRIAPVSWMVNNHVKEGKKHLNFSVWVNYSKIDKITLLDNINDEVKGKNMPLKSYALIHKNARLTNEQIDSLCNWTEKFALTVLENKE